MSRPPHQITGCVIQDARTPLLGNRSLPPLQAQKALGRYLVNNLARIGYLRVCIVCGKEFIQLRKNLRKTCSEECRRRKISDSLKGKHPSEETRKKLSLVNKGKPLSEEIKWKLKHPSEENRKRMSEKAKAEWANGIHDGFSDKMKKKWANPKQKAKWIAAIHTPENKVIRREKTKAQWADPEKREKRIARMKIVDNTPEIKAKTIKRTKERWIEGIYNKPEYREKKVKV